MSLSVLRVSDLAMIIELCPLCSSKSSHHFFRDKNRDYFRCEACDLIFVLSEQFLSKTEEKARYDQHQNNPKDQRYRQFLGRIFHPLNERLSPLSSGLDFGSGPGPTLSVMLQEVGHSVEVYDYYYFMEPALLQRKYDFVTATEVLEHLHNPRMELDRIWSCVKIGGYLGIMTKLALDKKRFERWHYKNDPTHVCFYSHLTLQWIATQWNAEITFVEKDAAIFQKV